MDELGLRWRFFLLLRLLERRFLVRPVSSSVIVPNSSLGSSSGVGFELRISVTLGKRARVFFVFRSYFI